MNLFSILKDHIGITLYSPICGECTLIEISYYEKRITVVDKYNSTLYFTLEGKFGNSDNGEILLFPSKENRNWDNFKTDIPIGSSVVVSNDGIVWTLAYYLGNCRVEFFRDNETTIRYSYIIPVNKFNFNDYFSNLKSKWNYGFKR